MQKGPRLALSCQLSAPPLMSALRPSCRSCLHLSHALSSPCQTCGSAAALVHPPRIFGMAVQNHPLPLLLAICRPHVPRRRWMTCGSPSHHEHTPGLPLVSGRGARHREASRTSAVQSSRTTTSSFGIVWPSVGDAPPADLAMVSSSVISVAPPRQSSRPARKNRIRRRRKSRFIIELLTSLDGMVSAVHPPMFSDDRIARSIGPRRRCAAATAVLHAVSRPVRILVVRNK